METDSIDEPMTTGTIKEWNVGDRVFFEDGTYLTICDTENNEKYWIGKGGQGIVYKVDYEGDLYAFKWIVNESFFYGRNDEYYENIKRLSEKKSQNKLRDFTPPIKVTKPNDVGQFGYMMKLIDTDKYVELKDFLSRKTNFLNLYPLLTACKNICSRLDQLHKFNYIFGDLNGGGFFINPNNGDLVICDCDNIRLKDDSPTRLGADGYRAPELYLDDGVCSIETDLHSLAVILFQMLMGMDPFLGRLYYGDEPPVDIYYKKAVFVFDPDDDSNRPNNLEYFKRWDELIDGGVKEELCKTLINGVKDPSMRTKARTFSGAFDSWMETIDNDDDPLAGKLDPPPADMRIQYVLFVVDCSNSMAGERINSVNQSIKETVEYLKRYSKDDCSIQYKIGVLQFSKDCRWNENYAPTPVSEIEYVPLNVTGNATLLHKAYMMLDRELQNKKLIDPKLHYKKSIIMLISDGIAPEKYRDFLIPLRDNHRFDSAYVVSIGIDDDVLGEPSFKQALLDFAKDDENCVIMKSRFNRNLGELISRIATSLSTLTTAVERNNELQKIVGEFVRCG